MPQNIPPISSELTNGSIVVKGKRNPYSIATNSIKFPPFWHVLLILKLFAIKNSGFSPIILSLEASSEQQDLILVHVDHAHRIVLDRELYLC